MFSHWARASRDLILPSGQPTCAFETRFDNSHAIMSQCCTTQTGTEHADRFSDEQAFRRYRPDLERRLVTERWVHNRRPMILREGWPSEVAIVALVACASRASAGGILIGPTRPVTATLRSLEIDGAEASSSRAASPGHASADAPCKDAARLRQFKVLPRGG